MVFFLVGFDGKDINRGGSSRVRELLIDGGSFAGLSPRASKGIFGVLCLGRSDLGELVLVESVFLGEASVGPDFPAGSLGIRKKGSCAIPLVPIARQEATNVDRAVLCAIRLNFWSIV